MCTKFGCGPTVVSKKKGTDRHTDRQTDRQTDKGKLQLYIIYIYITKVAAALGRDVCTSLLELHPWAGCDTMSAFAGHGKLKALKILLHEQKFIDVFATLGSSWTVANELFCIIEDFVCQLYCRNTKILKSQCTQVSNVPQQKRGYRIGKASTMRGQHTRRANYQATIGRRSLVYYPETPNPSQRHGWTTSEDDSLVINWMT